ncbi:MAG: tRNA 2-thiouridine(34) synthase MnmA [Oscillospiraceae bacterium]|nr:tRNA 2-thiouridine(34) synthase MnmA [Oscillospiraceae bacterium]
MGRIAVGMSGGTDSAAAALALLHAGETPIGVTLLLSGHEDVSGAEAVCRALGIEFHTADCRAEFDASVVQPFAEAYLRGETPNPCVFCNRQIKFGAFFRAADDLGCEKLATGHYAINAYDGQHHLLKGADTSKDQSYFLWTLDQEKLSRIVFPLGKLTKREARAMVLEAKLPVQSRESQDICFVPDGDCGGFLDRLGFAGTPGEVRDTSGKLLGSHNGLGRYTIGQRKGLGIAADRPLYVVKKDAGTNTVILGGEEELYAGKVILRDVQLVSGGGLVPMEAEVRLRYTRSSAAAKIEPDGNDGAVLTFEKPQRAPAAGQSAVFYAGDEVLGGGFIR